MTGGRLLRVADYVRDEEAFCLTYGDGVGDIDITALLAFHRSHGRDATMTTTRPRGPVRRRLCWTTSSVS
jgi:glucose-1-phosphate cytidylyltransferase